MWRSIVHFIHEISILYMVKECLFVKAENKKERKKCSAVLTSLGTHFAGNYLFRARCIFFPRYYYKRLKVLSLLEACFDLISGFSISMKIQIMGGKITENLGFKSPLRSHKSFCPFFVLFSNSP